MIVVVVEGYDGSGKTTVMRNLAGVLESRGFRCAQVGRGSEDANSHVAAMTAVIKQSDGGVDPLPPLADMFLRLARLHTRVDLVTALDCDVALLDRFLLYDLSRIPVDLRIPWQALFEQVAAALQVHLTVHLTASFELLWSRVSSCPPEDLSPKEARGRDHNHQGYLELERVLTEQDHYQRVEVVDCGQSIEAVTDAVSAAVLALLRSQG